MANAPQAKVEITDAYESLAGQNPRWVLTCDHASPRLPERWRWPAADHHLVGSHWSYDLGAAGITRALAKLGGFPAVLSRFTRLLIDPNRELDSATLFRRDAEGQPLGLATLLTGTGAEHEKAARRELYDGYHGHTSAIVAAHAGARLFSIHSFTPIYEGEAREMEIAVLFNRYDDMASCLGACISRRGYSVAMNDPYSGYDGLIAGIERHGLAHDRPYLEIEVRQDLAVDHGRRQQLVADLHGALAELDQSFPRAGEGVVKSLD